MQPASQRPHTLPVLLIVTLLIAQALATASLAAASQPADRPVTAAHMLADIQVFFEKCHFGNDDSFRHKTQ